MSRVSDGLKGVSLEPVAQQIPGFCSQDQGVFLKKENDYEFGMTFPSESLLPLLCAHKPSV